MSSKNENTSLYTVSKTVRTVLITGATSGIGKATAILFAKNGFKLILCGRRQDRLNQLENELRTLTAVAILNFDVRDKDLVFQQINSLSKEFSEIDILINNAGNAHGLDLSLIHI